MTPLEKSILATLVYYDVLERPLTGLEIFKYLIVKGMTEKDREVNLNEVLDTLETSQELAKLINQKNGFYFLRGRSKVIKERIARQKIADQKWKKARRLIRLLETVPFVRLVAVSGSLAMNNPKEEADIDLLIVTKASRIWTCRGLATLFVRLIGQHRHGPLTKDRLCLNHYLTDKSLRIPCRSLYNAQTYAHLVPIWGRQLPQIYNQFQKANRWIGDYLVFYPKSQEGYLKKTKSNRFLVSLRKIREFILDNKIGDGFEFFLKKFQERRIKKDPLTYQVGGRVVFDDRQLEFHPDSPERWILEEYNQRMSQLGLTEMGQEEDSGLIKESSSA